LWLPRCTTPLPTSLRKLFSAPYVILFTDELNRNQISAFVEGLFANNTQYDKFRLHLRDFLISLREFAGDNAELFLLEKEQQERDAKAADIERRSKVSGLLKPSEIEQEDDEL
jgi:exportin-1